MHCVSACICLFALLLLVLPARTEAWSLWFRSSSRPGTREEGTDLSDEDMPGSSQRVPQLPPLSLRRHKTTARHDRHMTQLMTELEERSRTSSCWKKAVDTLRKGCASLRTDDEARSRLALAMASCDGETDGGRRVWHDCRTDTDVQQCVDQLDDAQYIMYVQYRLHSDVLCLFILEEAFQERTDKAVQALYASALAASGTLETLESSSSALQLAVKQAAEQQTSNLAETRRLWDQLQELRTGQAEAFQSLRLNTQQIMQHVADATLGLQQLHVALDESATQATAAVRDVAREAIEFQKRTELHVSSMVSVLERVETFQQVLLEKTMGLSDVIRGAALLVLLLLFTVPARTAAARVPCMSVVGLSYALRPLVLTTPQRATDNGIFFCFVTIAVGLLLIFFACTYRSPEYVLRMLLRSEIGRVFEDMRPSLVEDIRQAVSDGVMSAWNCADVVDGAQQHSGEEAKLLLAPQRDVKTGAVPTMRKPSQKRKAYRSRSRRQ